MSRLEYGRGTDEKSSFKAPYTSIKQQRGRSEIRHTPYSRESLNSRNKFHHSRTENENRNEMSPVGKPGYRGTTTSCDNNKGKQKSGSDVTRLMSHSEYFHKYDNKQAVGTGSDEPRSHHSNSQSPCGDNKLRHSRKPSSTDANTEMKPARETPTMTDNTAKDDDILSILADDNNFDEEIEPLFGPGTISSTSVLNHANRKSSRSEMECPLIDHKSKLDEPFQIHAKSTDSMFGDTSSTHHSRRDNNKRTNAKDCLADTKYYDNKQTCRRDTWKSERSKLSSRYENDTNSEKSQDGRLSIRSRVSADSSNSDKIAFRNREIDSRCRKESKFQEDKCSHRGNVTGYHIKPNIRNKVCNERNDLKHRAEKYMINDKGHIDHPRKRIDSWLDRNTHDYRVGTAAHTSFNARNQRQPYYNEGHTSKSITDMYVPEIDRGSHIQSRDYAADYRGGPTRKRHNRLREMSEKTIYITDGKTHSDNRSFRHHSQGNNYHIPRDSTGQSSHYSSQYDSDLYTCPSDFTNAVEQNKHCSSRKQGQPSWHQFRRDKTRMSIGLQHYNRVRKKYFGGGFCKNAGRIRMTKNNNSKTSVETTDTPEDSNNVVHATSSLTEHVTVRPPLQIDPPLISPASSQPIVSMSDLENASVQIIDQFGTNMSQPFLTQPGGNQNTPVQLNNNGFLPAPIGIEYVFIPFTNQGSNMLENVALNQDISLGTLPDNHANENEQTPVCTAFAPEMEFNNTCISRGTTTGSQETSVQTDTCMNESTNDFHIYETEKQDKANSNKQIDTAAGECNSKNSTIRRSSISTTKDKNCDCEDRAPFKIISDLEEVRSFKEDKGATGRIKRKHIFRKKGERRIMTIERKDTEMDDRCVDATNLTASDKRILKIKRNIEHEVHVSDIRKVVEKSEGMSPQKRVRSNDLNHVQSADASSSVFSRLAPETSATMNLLPGQRHLSPLHITVKNDHCEKSEAITIQNHGINTRHDDGNKGVLPDKMEDNKLKQDQLSHSERATNVSAVGCSKTTHVHSDILNQLNLKDNHQSTDGLSSYGINDTHKEHDNKEKSETGNLVKDVVNQKQRTFCRNDTGRQIINISNDERDQIDKYTVDKKTDEQDSKMFKDYDKKGTRKECDRKAKYYDSGNTRFSDDRHVSDMWRNTSTNDKNDRDHGRCESTFQSSRDQKYDHGRQSSHHKESHRAELCVTENVIHRDGRENKDMSGKRIPSGDNIPVDYDTHKEHDNKENSETGNLVKDVVNQKQRTFCRNDTGRQIINISNDEIDQIDKYKVDKKTDEQESKMFKDYDKKGTRKECDRKAKYYDSGNTRFSDDRHVSDMRRNTSTNDKNDRDHGRRESTFQSSRDQKYDHGRQSSHHKESHPAELCVTENVIHRDGRENKDMSGKRIPFGDNIPVDYDTHKEHDNKEKSETGNSVKDVVNQKQSTFCRNDTGRQTINISNDERDQIDKYKVDKKTDEQDSKMFKDYDKKGTRKECDRKAKYYDSGNTRFSDDRHVSDMRRNTSTNDKNDRDHGCRESTFQSSRDQKYDHGRQSSHHKESHPAELCVTENVIHRDGRENKDMSGKRIPFGDKIPVDYDTHKEHDNKEKSETGNLVKDVVNQKQRTFCRNDTGRQKINISNDERDQIDKYKVDKKTDEQDSKMFKDYDKKGTRKECDRKAKYYDSVNTRFSDDRHVSDMRRNTSTNDKNDRDHGRRESTFQSSRDQKYDNGRQSSHHKESHRAELCVTENVIHRDGRDNKDMSGKRIPSGDNIPVDYADLPNRYKYKNNKTNVVNKVHQTETTFYKYNAERQKSVDEKGKADKYMGDENTDEQGRKTTRHQSSRSREKTWVRDDRRIDGVWQNLTACDSDAKDCGRHRSQYKSNRGMKDSCDGASYNDTETSPKEIDAYKDNRKNKGISVERNRYRDNIHYDKSIPKESFGKKKSHTVECHISGNSVVTTGRKTSEKYSKNRVRTNERNRSSSDGCRHEEEVHIDRELHNVDQRYKEFNVGGTAKHREPKEKNVDRYESDREKTIHSKPNHSEQQQNKYIDCAGPKDNDGANYTDIYKKHVDRHEMEMDRHNGDRHDKDPDIMKNTYKDNRELEKNQQIDRHKRTEIQRDTDMTIRKCNYTKRQLTNSVVQESAVSKLEGNISDPSLPLLTERNVLSDDTNFEITAELPIQTQSVALATLHGQSGFIIQQPIQTENPLHQQKVANPIIMHQDNIQTLAQNNMQSSMGHIQEQLLAQQAQQTLVMTSLQGQQKPGLQVLFEHGKNQPNYVGRSNLHDQSTNIHQLLAQQTNQQQNVQQVQDPQCHSIIPQIQMVQHGDVLSRQSLEDFHSSLNQMQLLRGQMVNIDQSQETLQPNVLGTIIAQPVDNPGSIASGINPSYNTSLTETTRNIMAGNNMNAMMSVVGGSFVQVPSISYQYAPSTSITAGISVTDMAKSSNITNKPLLHDPKVDAHSTNQFKNKHNNEDLRSLNCNRCNIKFTSIRVYKKHIHWHEYYTKHFQQ